MNWNAPGVAVIDLDAVPRWLAPYAIAGDQLIIRFTASGGYCPPHVAVDGMWPAEEWEDGREITHAVVSPPDARAVVLLPPELFPMLAAAYMGEIDAAELEASEWKAR